MQFAFYKVVLYRKKSESSKRYFVGLPTLRLIEFPSISFGKNSSVLGNDSKKLLNVVANKLKDNSIKIAVTAFPPPAVIIYHT